MKKIMLLLSMLSGMMLSASACSPDNGSANTERPVPTPVPDPKPNDGRCLIAYFSCTGTTEGIAEQIAGITDGDLWQIEPEEPYTAADLNYGTDCRANREQNDPSARPAIGGKIENLSDYDIVFLGYPIWWGKAPKIIFTFLESYDFAGKTIVPFCTSHSSGIGSSDADLHVSASRAAWLRGRRFSGKESKEELKNWIENMNLNIRNSNVGKFPLSGAENGNAPTIKLNSGYNMPILGLGTYSLHGEVCINSVKSALANGFRKFDTASIYGNEEEVGQAIRESDVPREEIFVTTKLYSTQFADADEAIEECLKKLNIGYIDLMLLHHPGANDVEAYKAMERAVAAGKIRSIGVSNYYIEEMEAFLPQVSVTPALVQNEIHPYYQEKEVIRYMHGKGIAVEAWYPFGGRGHTAAMFADETISRIAKVHGKSSAQIILRWDLQNGVVVIPGSSNPDHQKENISVFDFELTDEEIARIDALDRNEKHDWY